MISYLNEKSPKGILYNINYKGQEPCSNQLILDFKKKYIFAPKRLIIGNKLSIGGRNALLMATVQSSFTVQSQGQLYQLGALGEITGTPWCLGVSLKSRGSFHTVT